MSEKQELKQVLLKSKNVDADNFWRILFKLIFATENEVQQILNQLDPQHSQNNIQTVKRFLGYQKYQLIFLYYFRKYGIAKSFIITLLCPLPMVIVFYLLSGFLKYILINNYIQIALIGLRCSAISYLCRYSIHFPEGKLNWLIYLGSILFALFSNTNNTYLVIYIVTIFLSYFKSEDIQSRSSLLREQEQQKNQQENLKRFDPPPIKRKQFYFYLFLFSFIACWIIQRYIFQSHYNYSVLKLFFINLLNKNQQISIFLPQFYSQFTNHNPKIFAANILSFGYLFPGLGLKSFFLLSYGQNLSFLIVSYFVIYFPSLLMICIGIGYKSIFYTTEWKKIMIAIQAASNGLISVAAINLLNQETCHWNITFFTSLVIFTVTKLYKFNEWKSALLGIFLIASRASVLHLSLKKNISSFLCYSE